MCKVNLRNILLFSFPLLYKITAEHHARAKALSPTPTPPLRRHASTNASCGAGATSCNDGRPGCCEIGLACTFDSSQRPICAGSAPCGPACTGKMTGLCCYAGFTCDYQSTLCVTRDLTTSILTVSGILATYTVPVVVTGVLASETASAQVPPGPVTDPTVSTMVLMEHSLEGFSQTVTATSMVTDSQPTQLSTTALQAPSQWAPVPTTATTDISIPAGTQPTAGAASSQGALSSSANTTYPVSSNYFYTYSLLTSYNSTLTEVLMLESPGVEGLTFSYTTVYYTPGTTAPSPTSISMSHATTPSVTSSITSTTPRTSSIGNVHSAPGPKQAILAAGKIVHALGLALLVNLFL